MRGQPDGDGGRLDGDGDGTDTGEGRGGDDH